jgi:hypothetical protein
LVIKAITDAYNGSFLKQGIDSAISDGSNLYGENSNPPQDYSLDQSVYDFTSRVFPLNLGDQSYNGHYMVININVAILTKFSSVSYNGNPVNTFTVQNQELSKLDVLRSRIDKQYRLSTFSTSGPSGTSTPYSAPGGAGQEYVVPRYTRRIKESIAVFMPDTSVYTNRNEYAESSLGSIASEIVSSTTSGIRGGSAAGAVGEFAFQYAAGLATNPRTEVYFRNSDQRRFQFDFLFAPVNEDESMAIEEIIRTLRFHAAPEVNPLTQGGLFFVKPSEFDITFFNKGQENIHIPRINTCALEQIDVDYAPSGKYATFRNGHPVQIKLMMQFRELEINHRLRVLQGF